MASIVMPKSESLGPAGRGGGELWGEVVELLLINTVINKDSISLRLVFMLLICLLICEEVSTP